MPASVVTITEDDLFTAIRAFCLDVLGDQVEVVQGQPNRVPSPASANYVVMTPMRLDGLSTNNDTYTRLIDPGDGFRQAKPHIDAVFQLDVHGTTALDNCTILWTWFRDGVGCDSFAASGLEIQPLWATTPQQVPFINGEDQYEDRWTIDVHLQFNPVVQRPQQFAKVLGPIGLISVEATYPAGDD